MATLQFAPWSSDIEISFYAALASLKINHDKLNDAARKIVGRYEVRPTDAPERSARMQVRGSALTADEIPIGQYRAEGILKNVNTIEEYKTLDRAAVVERAGRTIWDAINDGTIYSCPSLLSSFYAIFFADLKKYRFTYHFAFPAIHSDPPWKLENDVTSPTASHLSAQDSAQLYDTVTTWKYSVDNRQHGFFLAKKSKPPDRPQPAESQPPNTTPDDGESSLKMPVTPKPPNMGYTWAVGSLSSYESGFFEGVPEEDTYVCFADPSNYTSNPGWMLRNLLILIRYRWRRDSIQIICYRDTHARRDQSHSLILKLKSDSTSQVNEMPKVTGWERNDNGKVNSRLVDLGDYMDPKRLADQSVDLNLKLMKWRIAPELDLDSVKNARCLLLGAGTLGSYVSRNLLGWGVKKITFVDNGKVSFSNPVRQPLFNFDDCTNGGKRKAIRAAEALKDIYPGVVSIGYSMSVPMAGHPIIGEEAVKQDFERLRLLIDEHDVIFLLMDTRESRWLPTVMGKAAGKIVLNAALGFDSYLVMRHGPAPRSDASSLGCYFCNDVVAPGDSLKDLTLDQQCTTTRPGIAAIASALLVEILVSLLQHPLKHHAPAPANRNAARDPPEHPLGLIPHQIRGFLASFDNMLIQGPAFEFCSACSPAIINAYNTDGWDFVKRALSEKGYVENLSGLAEVHRKAEAAEKDLEWDEDEAEDGMAEISGDGELL